MGFIKRAISKEYVCQFWCLFPEMKDSFTYLPHYSANSHPLDYHPIVIIPVLSTVFEHLLAKRLKYP